MAKRTIRKTDPDTTTAPEPRRPAERNGGAAPRARTPRSRRNAGGTTDAAADRTPLAAGAVEAENTDQRTQFEAAGASAVPHDHIAVRAYHLYLERGGRGGDEFLDWITAERELRQQTGSHR